MDLYLQPNVNHVAAKPLETSQWNPFENVVNSLSINKKARTLSSMPFLTKETTWRKTAPYQQTWKTISLGHLSSFVKLHLNNLSLMLSYNSLLMETLIAG